MLLLQPEDCTRVIHNLLLSLNTRSPQRASSWCRLVADLLHSYVDGWQTGWIIHRLNMMAGKKHSIGPPLAPQPPGRRHKMNPSLLFLFSQRGPSTGGIGNGRSHSTAPLTQEPFEKLPVDYYYKMLKTKNLNQQAEPVAWADTTQTSPQMQTITIVYTKNE